MKFSTRAHHFSFQIGKKKRKENGIKKKSTKLPPIFYSTFDNKGIVVIQSLSFYFWISVILTLKKTEKRLINEDNL